MNKIQGFRPYSNKTFTSHHKLRRFKTTGEIRLSQKPYQKSLYNLKMWARGLKISLQQTLKEFN